MTESEYVLLSIIACQKDLPVNKAHGVSAKAGWLYSHLHDELNIPGKGKVNYEE